jgi:glycosyltransferase involved in cell wall biosynthesis
LPGELSGYSLPVHVAIVGTYPPTRCGIATFTADVESSLVAAGATVTVVPVLPERRGSVAGPFIMRDDRGSYVRAAAELNSSDVDMVLVQHEFGIFGGPAGMYVLDLVDSLAIPFAVTLHTVLRRFDDDQATVVRQLASSAAAVLVFTSSARRLVIEQAEPPAGKLHVLPHGAPPELFAEIPADAARRAFGIPLDVPVMCTFGLLSPGKGIEVAIRALAQASAEHPDLHYVVAGRTHPEIVSRDGEQYRDQLQALADELGLRDRVIFVDRFLDVSELAMLLASSDLVCTPYRGEEQAVSGVLTFALAAGCPVVSTRYRYACDVLEAGAGLVVDVGDAATMASAVTSLLDPVRGAAARVAARRASALSAWPVVGARLHELLQSVLRPVPAIVLPTATRLPTHDEIGTAHLRLLCDDTAVLQHAELLVPRHEDGYCVDDAARLMAVLDRLGRSGETGSHGESSAGSNAGWHPQIGRLLGFVRWSAIGGRDGAMRNFMTWDRRWLDQPHIGDHVGRSIWALGEVAAGAGPFADNARRELGRLAPGIGPGWPDKTVIYALLGLVAADDPNSGTAVERCLPRLRAWRPRRGSWRWCHDRLDYDNARLPEVLVRVGQLVGEPDLVEAGAELLEWFDGLCRHGDHYRFPGHRGLDDVRALTWSGDEQPLEAAAMADAAAAWHELTGDEWAADAVDRSWAWFLGANRLGEPMFDLLAGAGFDGLGSRGVNRNCGAESTIAAFRCALARREVTEVRSLRAIGVGSVQA